MTSVSGVLTDVCVLVCAHNAHLGGEVLTGVKEDMSEPHLFVMQPAATLKVDR